MSGVANRMEEGIQPENGTKRSETSRASGHAAQISLVTMRGIRLQETRLDRPQHTATASALLPKPHAQDRWHHSPS
jgi:hypothetical protein